MTLRAHAKVNLRLRILGRDADGYHGLETLFLRLDLADSIRVALTPSPGISLSVDTDPELAGADVPEDSRNLAWRAARALLAASGQASGADIRLEKKIPAGSGLGGGSSDAAAVLTALNPLLERPLSPEALRDLGGELGSDVPFFLLPAGMALGWERGRGLLPLNAPPQRPALLVVPGFAIGSSEAYSWIAADRQGREPPRPSALPAPDRLSRWETLAELAVNDFEPVVFARYPQLADWKAGMEGAGAEIALLSGSGSALFGIYATEQARDRAAAAMSSGPDVTIIRTRTSVRGTNGEP